MHSLWRGKSNQITPAEKKFVLKYSHQTNTIYRLACLDPPSPGQAKMGSLKY
jgi:hypothetical protein